MDDVGEVPSWSGAAPADVDRMEALEQQVRQLTSRLAGWVEAQLVQALDDRRNDMRVLRSELQLVLDEQLAGIRAESSSVLSVAARRLEMGQEQLGERLEAVAARAAEAAAKSIDLSGSSSADAERLDILEQRVRSAMSRLSDSVEARLAETEEMRHAELHAFRTELQAVTDGRAMSIARRLDDVAAQALAAAEGVAALNFEVEAAPARVEVFEQRMEGAMALLADSIEGRLAEAATARDSDREALRTELVAATTVMEGRLDEVAQRAEAAVGDLTALRADAEAGTARTAELEQRVKAAVGRLAESVEGRLAELSDGLRRELGALVESTLAEVVERRRGELDAVRGEIHESLAAQLREARVEIGTVVADAHRRFVVSVDQLEERMHVVSEQATAAWTAAANIQTLQEAVGSDGRRIEALEGHTRRTDARLGDVVEAKLAEQAGVRGAQLEEVRNDLLAATGRVQEQVDAALQEVPAQIGAAAGGIQNQMRAALDAHLAETRAEVTLALGAGRDELAAGAADLATRQTALDERSTQAVAGLQALGASVETALAEAEARLAQTVELRLGRFEAVAAEVAEAQTRLDATAASLNRKVARAQDQVQKQLAALAEQMAALATAASTEAGTLAPLRSDLRLLRREVAELAEVVAEPRPRRKANAGPAGQAAAPAGAKKAAPLSPARKVAAARTAARRGAR